MFRKVSLACVTLPLLIVAVGCGSNGTVKVEGIVTLDGKPLADATVTFHSADGKGRTAIGTTDAQGNYSLQSYSANDGIVPGDYKVVVFVGGGAAAAGNNFNMDGAKRLQDLKTATIHANYSNLAQTPLKKKIDGKGKVDLQLKADGT